MTEYRTILTESAGDGVAVVRLNRPEQLNALNRQLMDELVAALSTYDGDDAVGAVVLTGNAAAFAAGADVTEMAEVGLPEMLTSYRFDRWEALRRFSKPLIAAVSGYALGGGLELAMLCDFIVASETARLGQPEINLGLMPGAGGTQRLARQLGKALAMEVVLAGRLLTAAEALRFGLVNRVVPVEMLLDEALELARNIAGRAPIAVRLAKQAILRAEETSLEQGLAAERQGFYLLFGTADAREGIRAFLEKRRPSWEGK